MAHNTMYKWLAKHIKEARASETDPTVKDATDLVMDTLVMNFVTEMEQRQPGSFDKQKFFDDCYGKDESDETPSK